MIFSLQAQHEGDMVWLRAAHYWLGRQTRLPAMVAFSSIHHECMGVPRSSAAPVASGISLLCAVVRRFPEGPPPPRAKMIDDFLLKNF